MHKLHLGKNILILSFLLYGIRAEAQEIVYNTTDAGVVLKNSEVKQLPQAKIDPLNITEAADIISPRVEEEEQDIYFSADEIQNDQRLETITATGDVNIVRDNLTVKADKIIYNQKDDIVTAVGNVVLLNEDGTVVFSDYVVLSDKMQAGEMDNIKIIMKDNNWRKCILHGDSKDIIKRLPDNSIDFILTDPPYNLGQHSTGNIPLPGRSAINNDVAEWDMIDFNPEDHPIL